MKSKFTILLVIIALSSLAITVYSQVQKTVPAGQGWEYQEIQLSRTESSLPKLNALGAQGWELVNVISACEEKSYCVYWAYLKRRK